MLSMRVCTEQRTLDHQPSRGCSAGSRSMARMDGVTAILSMGHPPSCRSHTSSATNSLSLCRMPRSMAKSASVGLTVCMSGMGRAL